MSLAALLAVFRLGRLRLDRLLAFTGVGLLAVEESGRGLEEEPGPGPCWIFSVAFSAAGLGRRWRAERRRFVTGSMFFGSSSFILVKVVL